MALNNPVVNQDASSISQKGYPKQFKWHLLDDIHISGFYVGN